MDDFLSELLGDVLRIRPTELRALHFLECDRATLCQDGAPVATSCSLREPSYRAAFSSDFTSCLLACGDSHDCFLAALSGTMPEPDGPFLECATRSVQCQIVSDACTALLVSPSAPLAAALHACLALDCEQLPLCLARAVLTDPSVDSALTAGPR